MQKPKTPIEKITTSPIARMAVFIFFFTILANVFALFFHKEDTTSLSYKIFIQPMLSYLQFMQNTLHVNSAIAVILLTITVKLLLSPISLYGRLHPSMYLKLISAGVQLPFLNALYFLATKQEAFINQKLFGLMLDQKSLTLSLCITVFYLANNLLLYQFNTYHIYYDRTYQQRILASMSPITILLVTLNVPSGMSLYLLISAIISLGETLIYLQKQPNTSVNIF